MFSVWLPLSRGWAQCRCTFSGDHVASVVRLRLFSAAYGDDSTWKLHHQEQQTDRVRCSMLSTLKRAGVTNSGNNDKHWWPAYLSLHHLLIYPDQGFAEMIHHRETVKGSSGSVQPGEIETFGAHRQNLPEVCFAVQYAICVRVGEGGIRSYLSCEFMARRSTDASSHGESV